MTGPEQHAATVRAAATSLVRGSTDPSRDWARMGSSLADLAIIEGRG